MRINLICICGKLQAGNANRRVGKPARLISCQSRRLALESKHELL
jgi:hypothetical protein